MSTEILPPFLNLENTTLFDNSIEKEEIDEIICSNNNNFNNNSAQLIFKSDSTFYYRLASNNSGFRGTFKFLSKTGANNDMNSEITLSSNFFAHLFKEAMFRIKGVEIEKTQNIAISMDMLYLIDKQDISTTHKRYIRYYY